MKLEDFRDSMRPRFSYMDKVIDSIYYAIEMQRNMILHGPGGHAKSTIVEEALKLYIGEDKFYSDVYIANASEDMDVTPVMGYDNIPKFQKEGVLEKILTDTIFMHKEYGILEEGFDAPGMFLNALKDPLMRGSICINGVCLKNKLKSLFICTNVSPKTWAGSDRSRLALLQRFSFIAEVVWPEYTVKTFMPFLEKRNIPNPIIAKFGEICHKANWPISPRSLEVMEAVYSRFGVQGLFNFEEIPEAVFNDLVAYEKNVPFLKELSDLRKRTDLLMNEKDPRNAIVESTQIVGLARRIKGIPVDGGFSEQLRKILIDCNAMIELCNDAIKQGKQLKV